MIEKIILLIIASILLFGCSKDDSTNNCPQPGSISIDQINSVSVLFTWGINTETAWEIEYGETGFPIGTGTVIQTSLTEVFIDGLMPATGYQIYLRTNCGSDGFSERISIDFVTTEASASCNMPTDVFLASLGADFIGIGWSENDETAWEIEYGESGFELGTGTVLQTSESTFTITGLTPATTYEIYVRANCGSDGFSDYTEALVITTNGS